MVARPLDVAFLGTVRIELTRVHTANDIRQNKSMGTCQPLDPNDFPAWQVYDLDYDCEHIKKHKCGSNENPIFNCSPVGLELTLTSL